MDCCRICLIPDPGNHYRENCCRACAAFFRRTIQLKLRYKCERFKDCKLTKDNRYVCKYCRMKRCIKAGMTSPEDPDDTLDSYLDDSSRILPEIEPSCSISSESGDPLDILFSEDFVLNNHDAFLKQYQEKIKEVFQTRPKTTEFPFELSQCQQGSLALEKHNDKWPNYRKEKIFYNDSIEVASIFCSNLKEVLFASEFCMEFSAFAELPLDQKMLLQAHFVPRFFDLCVVFTTIQFLGNDIQDRRVVLFSGQALDILKIQWDASKVSDFKEQELIQKLLSEEHAFALNYVNEVKKFNPDHFEYVYMVLSILWNVQDISGVSLETLKIAKKEQERLLEELMFYYKYDKKLVNIASRIYKMQNIFTSLDKLDGIRKEDDRIAKTFDMYNVDIYLNDTLPLPN